MTTTTPFTLLQSLLTEAKKLDDGYDKSLKEAIRKATMVDDDFFSTGKQIEDALQNLYEHIPQQTENADWWPTELGEAMENTKQLLDL